MSKSKNKPNVANVVIKPVKWISPELWRQVQDLFCATYQTGSKWSVTQSVGYEMAQNFRLALAYDGDRMIGFVKILDFDSMKCWTEKAGGRWGAQQGEHAFWNEQRPSTLNRRQIETCWVHHRYQSQGIATRLYQYAIQQMGATHIHIDENRVVDRIDYWRELGFVKCSLYRLNGGEPDLRLHLDGQAPDLWDLNQFNILAMFDDRDMVPLIRGTKFYRNIVAQTQHRICPKKALAL